MEEIQYTDELLKNIRNDLLSIPPDVFISKWIMEKTPNIFCGNEVKYYEWKHKMASRLQIDARDIIITGSACLGYSLNPKKNFKKFSQYSDIDVGIISNYYFDIAWHELRNQKYYKLNNNMKQALEDHRNRLIYWGTIATDKILPILSFGKLWNEVINEMRSNPPINEREINFRIYKDNKSFRDYQINSVRECQEIILGGIS